jgi:hypothetical protein
VIRAPLQEILRRTQSLTNHLRRIAMNDFEPGRSEDKNQPKINEDSIQTYQPEALSKTATGPRTSGGKRRSKMNAAKHGIFTAGILEGVERKADHDKLVDELRDHFQPHGTFEELLVEKLAMLYRRHRRLLIAESADILNQRSDERLRREALEEEDRLKSKKSDRGLMEFLDNPFVIDRCLELVSDWRERICQRGYDAYFDFPLMRKLYGRCLAEELDTRMQERIRALVNSELEKPEVRSDQEKQALQEKQFKDLLSQVDEEIEYLKHTKSVLDHLGSASRVHEKDSQLVPRAENVDRIIRYEAHICREIDRTVAQLLQSIRMRLGHPAPPSVNIEIGQ